jgi:5-oxoprolinase (ATP-hydrolysing)
LREGSAGIGKWRGGEGVQREIEVLEGMQVSILSEVSVYPLFSWCLHWVFIKLNCSLLQRRTRQPYGLEGGGHGGFGRNTWIKQPTKEDGDLLPSDGSKTPPEPREINIGGKATIWMGKGDRLLIETPGGGAWGVPVPDEGVNGDVGKWRGQEESQKMRWAARGSLAERVAAQAAF